MRQIGQSNIQQKICKLVMCRLRLGLKAPYSAWLWVAQASHIISQANHKGGLAVPFFFFFLAHKEIVAKSWWRGCLEQA